MRCVSYYFCEIPFLLYEFLEFLSRIEEVHLLDLGFSEAVEEDRLLSLSTEIGGDGFELFQFLWGLAPIDDLLYLGKHRLAAIDQYGLLEDLACHHGAQNIEAGLFSDKPEPFNLVVHFLVYGRVDQHAVLSLINHFIEVPHEIVRGGILHHGHKIDIRSLDQPASASLGPRHVMTHVVHDIACHEETEFLVGNSHSRLQLANDVCGHLPRKIQLEPADFPYAGQNLLASLGEPCLVAPKTNNRIGKELPQN